MQPWKNDPTLYDCPRNQQNKKMLNYDYYVKEFISSDPVKDWDSIQGCINLFNFFLSKVTFDFRGSFILDVGTKDGQMVEYLNKNEYSCTGIEYDRQYVEYAQSKGRNVIFNDVCNMDFIDRTFDLVLAHHVLGLCPDYKKAYQEMLRVSDNYVVTLNHIPGNPRKHYSLINDPSEVFNILSYCPKHDIVYADYINKNNEFVVILKKL